MEMTPLNSRNISSVGFEDECLKVTFSSGISHVYSGVPASVFQSLIHSEEPGMFFEENIKDEYTFEKI